MALTTTRPFDRVQLGVKGIHPLARRVGRLSVWFRATPFVTREASEAGGRQRKRARSVVVVGKDALSLH